MIHVYNLRYSKNPFDCPEMLIGLGVGLGMLGIIVIIAICCYACGKYWRQRDNQNGEDEPNTSNRWSQIYQNVPRIMSRYMRSSSRVSREESHINQV